MRDGSVTGTRVARRMVSTLGIARRRAKSCDEPIGAHDQRIAAAHDDVADLGVRGEPRERGREVLERARAAARADHARARAEAAVHRAAIGHEEERAVGVALTRSGATSCAFFAERIDEIAGDLAALVEVRHALPADGAARIAGIGERRGSKA